MGRPTHSTDKTYAPKNPVRQDSSGAGNINEFGTLEIDLCDGLLRVHNDVVPGGVAVIQLIPNCGPNMKLAPALPPADIVFPAGTGTVVVQHGVAIIPIVQVYDVATGTVINDAVIQHVSATSFSVTIADPAVEARIVYRF